MTSNVLPLFWNLASSSKETRLEASADLVANLEGFQREFQAGRGDDAATDDDEDVEMNEDAEEDDEDDDAESGIEVDGSDDGDVSGELDEDTAALDASLTRDNAEDVSYTVKRLVRGLASSRESSRLGFAVALTEVSIFPLVKDVKLILRSCSHEYIALLPRKSSPLSSEIPKPTRA
jgi:DNA polymerase phi